MTTQSEEVLVDDEGNVIEESAPQEENTDGDAVSVGDVDDAPASVSAPDDSDEDDDPPVRSASEEGETDDEREAIRERRRKERHDRKLKQKEREESLRSELAARDAELAQIRETVNAIQRKNNSAEMAQLGQAKQQIANAYNHFKDQIRIATEAADGATVAEATEKMMLARQRFAELENIEKAYTNQSQQPAPLDPRLKGHAERWMTANKWYDPSGADEDSEIMLKIDERLAREGWNPTTPEYWDELSKRAGKFLPHRFVKNRAQTQQKKTVVGGSGRESGASGSASAGFRLSADRVQALKDAGLWNDPAKRSDAIKRFRQYDKENKS